MSRGNFDDQEVGMYLELYFDMDRDNSGTVSRKEMRTYLEKEGHDSRTIDKIVKTFDLNKSGLITFEEWCAVLGVDHTQTKPGTHTLAHDVTLISADMHPSMQRKVTEMTRHHIENSKDMKEAAKNLKGALDKRFDRLWHCVIVKGQYWAYYSHEPKHSFVFKLGSHIVVVWRTPMY